MNFSELKKRIRKPVPRKAYISAGAFTAIIVAVIVGFSVANKPQEEEFHIHAGFVLFQNDEIKDFSDIRYMNLSTCSINEDEHEDLTPEEEQLEKAHLHDGVGDVLHSHFEGGTIQDLFTNIDHKVSKDAYGYINGIKTQNILNKNFKEYDRILIIDGDDITLEEKERLIKEIPTKADIIEVENTPESCGI